MYLPQLFAEMTEAQCLELIGRYPLATVIASLPEGPTINHLPLVWDAERSVLIGHMARANPLWRLLDRSPNTVAIFHGPHAFVPSHWYGSPTDHVPTWNYAVVHAHGRTRVLRESRDLLSSVRRLVATFQPEGHPAPLDPPSSLITTLIQAIVAFEIIVERWECKSKLSQNRDPEDRERVEQHLRSRNAGMDREVADLMRRWVLEADLPK